MTAILFALISFFSTTLGGLVSLHQRRHLSLIMAFSGGVLVAAALLDLLPEALQVIKETPGASIDGVLLGATGGFLVFYALERLVHIGAAGHCDKGRFGTIGALGLSIHSFLDGFAIGVAFQVNPTLGLIVALAVIAHDFSDGVSTVALVLGSRGALKASIGWLLVDASAPVVGAVVAQLLVVQPSLIGVLLGVFAGSFLFIGGSHLLPESHQEQRPVALPAAVVAGFIFIFVVTHVLPQP